MFFSLFAGISRAHSLSLIVTMGSSSSKVAPEEEGTVNSTPHKNACLSCKSLTTRNATLEKEIASLKTDNASLKAQLGAKHTEPSFDANSSLVKVIHPESSSIRLIDEMLRESDEAEKASENMLIPNKNQETRVDTLEKENASLNTDNVSLKTELDASKAKSEAVEQEKARFKSETAALKAQVASLESELKSAKASSSVTSLPTDKSKWLPVKKWDPTADNGRGGKGAMVEIGKAPPPPCPPFLTKGPELGQKTFESNPRKWSIKVSVWMKLVEFFMSTETWKELAVLREGEGNITTDDVVNHFIKPLTKKTGCSIALLMNADKDSFQNAQCMISHTWRASIVETYRCFKEIDPSASLFFCAFSLYQNDVEEVGSDGSNIKVADHPNGLSIEKQVDLTPFAKIIKSDPYYGMFVVHTSIADVYERLWVVHEADEARAAGIKIRGLFDLDSFKAEDIKKLEASVDTQKAQVSVESDRVFIEKRINEHGGYEKLDARIKELRSEMNNHLLPKAAKAGNASTVKALIMEKYDISVKDNVRSSSRPPSLPFSLSFAASHTLNFVRMVSPPWITQCGTTIRPSLLLSCRRLTMVENF